MVHVFRIEDSNPYAKSIVDFLKTLDFVHEEKIDNAGIFGLTDEHQQIIEQRIANHLSGESKSYTWEEVKANARKALQDKIQ